MYGRVAGVVPDISITPSSMAAAPDPPAAGEAATASRDWAQQAAPLLVAWTSRSAFFRRWRRPVGWRGWRWERIGAFLLAILAAVPLKIGSASCRERVCQYV